MRFLPLLGQFGRATRGATAVEFALVAMPFLFMLFAIFEIGRMYTLNSVLEDATMVSGRMVRTGELQTSGRGADAFRESVCERMGIFGGDCENSLSVDVRVMPQFANQTAPDPVVDDQFEEGVLTFEPGSPQDIVLVRTWWRTPIFVPMVTQGLRRLADDRAVLAASVTFRNEPYA